MAAVAASCSFTSCISGTPLKPTRTCISSSPLIMVASITAMLFAGRFGLAPSANRKASAGLKLEDRASGLQTGDPAGFTGTDTLACGAMGHVIGVGIVLGLRYLGAI